MIVQHHFSLRVGDLNVIPLKKVEGDKSLKTQWAKAIVAKQNQKLIDVLSDSGYTGQAINVIDEEGSSRGLVTPEMLINYLASQCYFMVNTFDTLLETAGDAICGVDSDQRVIIWNSHAQRLYNLPAEKVLGNPINNFFNNLIVTRSMQENRDIKSHYHQPCAGKHVLINASPIKSGHTNIGGISCERDITEMVQLNQELVKASSQVKILENEIKKMTNGHSALDKLIGRSPQIRNIVTLGKKVASTDAAILIRGESGTGKELFARAIHMDSPRKNGSFITVNCGAIPINLFESELFGYAPGTFSSSDMKGKPGIFELADGGTVFLDEVGELPADMQVKLLRVLQDKSFFRMGSTTPVEVNVRVIAATHRELENMISHGQFRDDLYYSLNVVSIEMPPLKERKEDIPELVHLFIQEFCQIYRKNISRVEPEVTNAFLEYSWPGNVRELKNAVERLVVLAEDEVVNESCLPENLRRNTYISLVSAPNGGNLINVAVEAERQLILKTLDQANGNRSETARLLGIPRSTLYYKLRQFGIPTKNQG